MKGVSLSKGNSISLSKSLVSSKIAIGLGWKAKPRTKFLGSKSEVEFDLDASAFLLNSHDKVSSEQDFVFYKNFDSSCGSVHHTGDELEGSSEGEEGDCETIYVDLDKIPNKIAKIAFSVTIYDAKKRGQSFKDVKDAYIRIYNRDDDSEIANYYLTDKFGDEDAVVIAMLIRKEDSSEWEFKASGEGYKSGLAGIVTQFGLKVNN